MNDETAQAEMPRYRPHKTVHALKVGGVSRGDGTLTLSFAGEDARFAPVELTGDEGQRIGKAMASPNPDTPVDDLGYFVVYADGYRSWSPTRAFEEGYSRIALHDVEQEGGR